MSKVHGLNVRHFQSTNKKIIKEISLVCSPNSVPRFQTHCYYFHPFVKPDSAVLQLALSDRSKPGVEVKAAEGGSRLCNRIQLSSLL